MLTPTKGNDEEVEKHTQNWSQLHLDYKAMLNFSKCRHFYSVGDKVVDHELHG